MVSPGSHARDLGSGPDRVRAEHVDTRLTLLVHGRLDTDAGSALLAAVRTGVADGVARLEVDLRDIEEFTEEGADSLVEVRHLGAGLADGVYYRTTAGAGADALLVAFASPADVDADD